MGYTALPFGLKNASLCPLVKTMAQSKQSAFQHSHTAALTMQSRADAMAELGTHLSSSRPALEGHQQADLRNGIAKLLCPGLSLKHVETEDHHHFSDRKQAEKYALNMLSRPLEASVIEAPEALLQNVYASFAVLVDSRLRAYTTFLARHALTLSEEQDHTEHLHPQMAVRAVEEKIAAILSIGKRVDANTFYTRFEVQPKAKTSGNVSTSLLCFVAAMDLNIPVNETLYEAVSTSFSTSGSIQGTFTSNGLDTAVIELDVPSLLKNMVDQASKVVSTIVGVASNACGNHGKHQISRSASFLSMPPPKAKSILGSQFSALDSHRGCIGLELLSQAAKTISVVTPDIGFTRSVVSAVPSFELEDVSHLSADQCANIIDTCLFDEDLDMEPVRKKPKTDNE